jgi:hypothetical protein
MELYWNKERMLRSRLRKKHYKRKLKAALIRLISHTHMLTTIAVILLILWIVGLIALPAIGWVIHILLVVAIILFLISIIKGKNPVQ